jgi:hypothetical protein
MDLSIIIVSWNVRDKLNKNLEAIFNSQTKYNFEVFVVDNNSSDGSSRMVTENYPEVNLIKNNDNLGFSKANNQAIRQAKGKYILLLNPDMLMFPETIENMLNWVNNNQQATVSGCKLISENYQIIEQVRKFPKLFDQLMIILKIPHLFPSVLNSYLQKDFNYEKDGKVDSIRGAFFLINRENYQKISGKKIPLLDERYFIWFEEVDFCREVYKLGGEVWYSSKARCLDYVGSSFSQVKRKKTQIYFRDSMLKYFKKWEKKSSYYIIKWAWKLVFLFIK